MNEDQPRRFSPSMYAWIATSAALIVLAAVYLTSSPPDNAGTRIGAETLERPVGPAADSSSSGLIAFVKRVDPIAVPEVTFTDGDGNKKTLADFKGKTILLNLWATWCGPCREEMPALDKLQAEMGSDKFEVVALSVDRGGLEASQKFLDKIKVKSLATYVDATGKATKPLRVIGMPTTLLIDADGREVGRLVGPAHWDSADAKKLIEATVR